MSSSKTNIAIIGMPGSGKTTVGIELAKISERNFADIDGLIEQENNMKISKIFEKYGEQYFRQLEKNMIEKISRKENTIIATGGGSILDIENYKNIKKSSTIIYLKRKLEELDISGRPLSKGGIITLQKLFKKRKKLYEKYSDYTVDNIDIHLCAREILNITKS